MATIAEIVRQVILAKKPRLPDMVKLARMAWKA